MRSIRPAAFLSISLSLWAGALAQAQVKIMPLGDSITKGAVDPAPSLSGYRARLFDDLITAGIQFRFVGAASVNSNKEMIAAGQQFHDGFGSYRMDDLRKNFDAAAQPHAKFGDNNMGGFWLTDGNGTNREAVYPDIILLLAGTNDLGEKAPEAVLESRMTDILAWFRTNRPQAEVFVGTVPPRGPNKPGFETYNPAVDVFNAWLASKVPFLGNRVHLVDIHGIFVNADGQAKGPDAPDGKFLKDGIHPSHNAYVAMGDAWFQAIKPFLQSSTMSNPASPASP